MPQRQTTNSSDSDVLTGLQVSIARLEERSGSLETKLVAIDKKIDVGFENLKGYVPAEIYRLNMEAQKIINDNHESRLKGLESFNETNATGIKFSSDIVKNILKTIAGVIAAGIIIYAGFVLLKNGGGL